MAMKLSREAKTLRGDRIATDRNNVASITRHRRRMSLATFYFAGFKSEVDICHRIKHNSKS